MKTKQSVRIISIALLICAILSLTSFGGAAYTPRASFATYTTFFEASMPIPAHTMRNGINVPAWTLPVKMNYRIQYNTNTGKIVSATFLNAQFFPQNITSPGNGYAQATSINNEEKTTIAISSDGYSLVCKPTCSITLIYTEIPGAGMNEETIDTPQLSGPTVTVYPERP